jgi:hypothetical protein
MWFSFLLSNSSIEVLGIAIELSTCTDILQQKENTFPRYLQASQ